MWPAVIVNVKTCLWAKLDSRLITLCKQKGISISTVASCSSDKMCLVYGFWVGLCVGTANDSWRYNVTPSAIGLAHNHNDPWMYWSFLAVSRLGLGKDLALSRK